MTVPGCHRHRCRRQAGRWTDAGEIVTGWLTRLTITLAVLGVLAYDGIAYGVSAIDIRDAAADGARAAADDFAIFRDVERAYESATAAAGEESTIPPETFTIDNAGTVSLVARRSVDTLVLRFLPRSGEWLTVEATAAAAAR